VFDSLSDRFDGIFGRLRGRGRLTDKDVDEVLREIRLALLEADVNFQVVKTFQGRVREACKDADLTGPLKNPAHVVVDIVRNELAAILGGETLEIRFNPKPPTVILMAGLQGSGKTTNTGKLARWRRPPASSRGGTVASVGSPSWCPGVQ
jgi:signal recognition particle subunit SRP54